MVDVLNNTNNDEVMSKILQKKMNCPICKTEFIAPRVRTPKIRLHSTDDDLRPYYEGIDTVAYEVITCTVCGYSAIAKTFENINDLNRVAVEKYLLENYKKREWPLIVDTQTAIEKFLLALQCLESRKGNVGEKAYIYLKLSWLFRVHTRENALESELFCQKKFIESAEKTFAELRFPVLDFEESVFLYLIGEISRRVGDYERANKYIGKVLIDRNTSEKLKERAMDCKDAIRKEKPSEATN